MPGRADAKIKCDFRIIEIFTKLCIFAKWKETILVATLLCRRQFPGAEQQTDAAVAKEAGARRRRPQERTVKCLNFFILKMYSQSIPIFAIDLHFAKTV
jgi:hypothetical protein